ncbi:MAG TPA: gliding motility-associated C-terminal domain-containing protein, partial [Bacteroidia bacterium]|nr:gliding motility-associated C-terminal domain-containing protein [Bacteroidia bacterium]
NGYCQWPINAAIPSNADPMNSIMAPWHDIDPSVGTPTSATDVNWQVFGTAPCREFCISWNDVAMYDCNNLIATSQVILHETTNIIDMYIQNKPLCTSWNGGAAIEGIQDASGTNAYSVPGRNYPTQWTASNDGWRFMPSGTPNYSIVWAGPSGTIGTTNTVNVCPTATTSYTATVTNASCSGPIVVSDVVTVNVTNSMSASVTSTPASCTSNNGTATATPSGGSGNYTYNWAPSGGTSATATGLSAGTYTVTISDANTGCQTTQTVNVTNTGNLSSSNTTTSISCNGGTASSTVTPVGGTGPFTYSWAPTGGNSSTATGLAAGTYTCTVTDANGCTSTQVINVTQPPALTASNNITNVDCNGNSSGAVTVTPSGGSGGYMYTWAPAGGSNPTASNLPSGTYSCTITDSNGCTTTSTANVTEPAALSVSVSVAPVSCTGTTTATANVSGGTGTYNYAWSSGGNAQTEGNLSPGSYTLTVTDANNCAVTSQFNVVPPVTMTVTSTFTDASCFGGSDATATVNPSGGTAPYTYSWSPSGGTNATATGLAPGTYTCTITDAGGCTATQTVSVSQPTQLSSTTTSNPATCFAYSDGSGSVTAAGGTPGYTYSWAPSGGTAQSATGLQAGTYTVTTTDANGCITTQSVTVTQPTQLNVTTTPDAVCAGSQATISASASGGTAPYAYSWQGGGTSATNTVTPVSTTVYTVSITDANNCTTTGSVTVTVNPGPVAAFGTNAINGVFSLPGPTGNLCFTDNSSSNVVAWYWQMGTDTSTSQNPCVTVTQQNAGTYCAELTVTTAAGCTDTADACIEINNVSYFIPNVFTPNGDGTNDVFKITNTGMSSLHCEVYDRWGNLVYEWNDPTGFWDGKVKSGNEAVDGVYYYVVDMADFTGKNYNETGFVHLIKGN